MPVRALAAATGHSVSWLRVPQQGREYLRAGPLYDFCDRIVRELVANRALWAVVNVAGKWDLALGLSVVRHLAPPDQGHHPSPRAKA